MTLCHCGCGEPTQLAKKTSTRDGTVKGQPCRYLPGHHMRTPELRALHSAKCKAYVGNANPNWRGGVVQIEGYEAVYVSKGTYKFRHRLIAEQQLGRSLKQDEVVVFLDGNQENLAPANLRVVTGDEQIRRMHEANRKT